MPRKNIKIIATVGASIFSNFRGPAISEAFKKAQRPVPDLKGMIQALFTGRADLSRSKIDYLKKNIDTYFLWRMKLVEPAPKKWSWELTDDIALNKHASAEVQSVLEMMEKIDEDSEVQLYFLVTDTEISSLAAELVGNALEKHFQEQGRAFQCFLNQVPGLRVDDKHQFMEEGFQGLIQEIERIAQAEPQEAEVQMNITGGFKGVVPILTVTAQLFDYPLFYMYEFSRGTKSGNVLLEIPPLPIQFDWSLIEVWQPFLTKSKIPLVNSSLELAIIKKQLIPANLFKEDGQGSFERTTLGSLFNSYIEHKTPHGRSVLGYLMEYKFFECWLETYQETFRIQRSVYIDGVEMDLVIQAKENANDQMVWGEVKSFGKVQFAFKNKSRKSFGYGLAHHLKKQLSKESIDRIQAYHLMVYYYPNQDLDNLYFNNNLRKIAETLAAKGISEFKVFVCRIDLPTYHLQERSNPYTQGLMNKKLTLDNSIFSMDQQHPYPRFLLVEPYTNF